MGRGIRRVPPNWQHPKNEDGKYKPMYDQSYGDALREWLKGHEQWEAGTHEGLVKYGHTKEEFPYYADYGGNAPCVEEYRPNWKPEEMTWYQVYENVSEGTPVTPPFATKQELVEYLVANGDFWDQQRRAEGSRFGMPCEPWSRIAATKFVFGSGWAPSMVIAGGEVKRGVDAI